MNLVDAIGRAARLGEIRAGIATIESFDEATSAYVVAYQGALVGPVWSENGVRYPAGRSVTVLVQAGRVARIVP